MARENVGRPIDERAVKENSLPVWHLWGKCCRVLFYGDSVVTFTER